MKITGTSTKTGINHVFQEKRISMWLVQKIKSYQRFLPLEPKKPKKSIKGKKESTCEWNVCLIEDTWESI